MEKYDVIVVGSGPAGVSAGLRLLSRGISCLLIDRCRFPREKTCGGLLTVKSLELLRELTGAPVPEGLLCQKTGRVEIHSRGQKRLAIQLQEGFALCHRRELDSWLVQSYRDRGGSFLPETKVRQIDREQHRILCGDGTVLEYGHLIAADGARSMIRRAIGQPEPVLAMGLETLVPTEKLRTRPDSIILDVGILPDGYVWVFPKGEMTLVGLACTQNKQTGYAELLQNYLKEVCGYEEPYTVRGALLPYGRGIDRIADPAGHVLLIGDAAGFTDPVTGEGIYYALLSGIRAADAVASDSTRAEAAYSDACRDIRRQMRGALRQTRLFYRFRERILRLAAKHTGMLTFYCREQIQKNRYKDGMLPMIRDYYREKRAKKS